MGSVVIRNLDDAVIARLKTKAELHGRSLEAELRHIVVENSKLTPDEKLARIDAIRLRLGGPFPDSTDLLREDRDRR